MDCLWGAEPLNRRKTRTDLSTSLLPISYKYDDRETGIPTVIVTLFPWRKQLSSKICCPALQLTAWEKNQFDWRQQDMVSRFSAFCILVPLLYGFIMSWRKPFKIGPQQSSTKACFDENKQRNAYFTGKLSGYGDLPERVLEWFSQSSARYRRYQTKTIFQGMASIRGTLPKGLLAHVVFIPNKYPSGVQFDWPSHSLGKMYRRWRGC